MAVKAIIEYIGEKVARLIEDNERVREECASVTLERDTLRKDNRELKEVVASLEKRIKILELSEGLTAGTADTKRARTRINHLMREIDRCIALMNSK